MKIDLIFVLLCILCEVVFAIVLALYSNLNTGHQILVNFTFWIFFAMMCAPIFIEIDDRYESRKRNRNHTQPPITHQPREHDEVTDIDESEESQSQS